MKNNVVVSVIMPMKNAEAFVQEAVQSILKQTFPYFELIVIDDQSTDNSVGLVRSFLDDRVKIVRGNGKGISAALNIGLKSAIGDYICRCDSDDTYPIDRLKAQVDWLAFHREYIAVSGKFSSIDNRSATIKEFQTGKEECNITKELLTGITRTHLGTYLIHKSILVGVGGYREYFITAEDIDLQLRVAEKGLIGYIPQNMYFYRIHNDSITHVQGLNKRMFYENLARAFLKQRIDFSKDDLQKGVPPEPPIIDGNPTDSTTQIIGYMIGESWRLHKDEKKLAALSVSIKACIKRPFDWLVWKNIVMILIK